MLLLSVICQTFQCSADLRTDLQENIHPSSENRLNTYTFSKTQLNINNSRKQHITQPRFVELTVTKNTRNVHGGEAM